MLKKYFVSLFLVLSCTFYAMGADIVIESGGINYTINTSGNTAIISPDAKNKSLSGDIIVASSVTYNEKPYSVTTIKNGAFSTSGIESIIIPESVTILEDDIFKDCKSLKVIIIKGEISNKLGKEIFKGCEKLEAIYFTSDKIPNVSNGTFSNIGNTTFKIYVPEAAENSLKGQWNKTTSGGNLNEYVPNPIADGAEVPKLDVDTDHQFFTFKRNIASTENWQALYLPFSLDYKEWKDEFDIAKLINIHRYYNEDGTEQSWLLEVIPITSGSTKPLTPYVIRGKHTGECTIDVNNKTVYKAEKKSITCWSTEMKYTFEGTIEDEDHINHDGWYIISEGALRSLKNASATSKLRAFRWILKTETNGDNGDQLFHESIPASPAQIRIAIRDDLNAEKNSIESTHDTQHNVVPVAYYSINGNKYAYAKKGLNIVKMSDGSTKKIYIK